MIFRVGEKTQKHSLFTKILGVIFFIIFVLHFRVFVMEPYTVPSSSMEKSVHTGAYLWVSKFSYGPRIPLTPLAIPFTHRDFLGIKSYIESVQLPYFRLPGLGDVERNDLFVFNFPEGDTVATMNSNASYYGLCRMYGRDNILSNSSIVYRPVDREDVYIKRCVAIAGDLIEIRDRKLFINEIPADNLPTLMYNYDLKLESPLNEKRLAEFGIFEPMTCIKAGYQNSYALTDSMVVALESFPSIVGISPQQFSKGEYLPDAYGYPDDVFPHSPLFPWNRDNFGPLRIPKKGMTITLSVDSLPLYQRIIEVYEHNELLISGSDIFINGEKTNTYTFRMDYYWAMGDNRHNSLDSRYWGFVPEDHVVGKVVLNSSDLF